VTGPLFMRHAVVARALRRLGVFMAAVFVLSSGFARVAQAQVDTTTRVDSARVDSLARAAARADSARATLVADSLRADSLRAEAIRRRAERLADTIKAPMATFVAPPDLEAVDRLRFTRETMFSSGAFNLADLLDQVPGVTTFRSSWFPGVHAAAFQGDFRRIRVFLDGLELDAPDPRNNGVLDLTEISLSALDEVVVERAAGEVRVWLRSWTVRDVTPYTRTDIYTGDLNTNGFRGLFGRRYMNGALFQLTLQQGESTRQRGAGGLGGTFAPTGGIAGDGDVQQITARLGWARGLFSVDGYLLNTRRTRDSTGADPADFALPAYAGSRRDAYLRAGYGDPTRGLQVQALMASLRTARDVAEDAVVDTSATAPPVDDASRSRNQRLLQVAYGWKQERVSAFARWRTIEGRTEFAPGVQLSATRGWATAAAHGERMGLDSSIRLDATVRLAPRSWLVATFANSELRPDDDTGRPSERALRAEGALRLGRRWFTGGVVRQSFGTVSGVDTAIVDTDTTFSTVQRAQRQIIVPRLLTPYQRDTAIFFPTSASTGVTFGVLAPLYKDVRLELRGTRWSGAREYRPQTQVRAAFILQSEWRSRFPRGDFGINARLIHEYRSGLSFVDADEVATSTPFRQSEAYNLGMAVLEIRIQRATLFYHFRNVYGGQYAQIPGVPMPPPFQTYGVRWEWFN
jgi:hypothetical protein